MLHKFLSLVVSFVVVFGGLTLTTPAPTLTPSTGPTIERDTVPSVPYSVPSTGRALASKGRTVIASRAILAPASPKRWGCRPWTDSLVGGSYRACGWY